jgi:hypothetical protein
MEEKKFDKIFRDKLVDYTENPRPEVWSQLEKRLGHKPRKSYPWLRVAASGALLMAAGMVGMKFWSGGIPDEGAFIYADHPAVAELPAWELLNQGKPEAIDQDKGDQEPAQVKNNVTMDEVSQPSAQTLAIPELAPIRNVDVLAPMHENELKLARNSQSREIMENPLEFEVTIVYKATEDTTRRGPTKLGQILDFAKEFKPGEMLADLRDAKNDLLNK